MSTQPQSVCGTCRAPVEYVPTPLAATAQWHPPFWRHVDPPEQPHGAVPVPAGYRDDERAHCPRCTYRFPVAAMVADPHGYYRRLCHRCAVERGGGAR